MKKWLLLFTLLFPLVSYGAWNTLPGFTGFTDRILTLANHRAELYAGGDFDLGNFARRTPNGWEAVGGGVSLWGETGGVNKLLSRPEGLWVGGIFDTPADNIAIWNGGWTDVGGVSGALRPTWPWNLPEVLTLGNYQGDVVAAGAFLRAGEVLVNSIARYDGGWRSFGQGTNGAVWDTLDWGGYLWIAGEFTLPFPYLAKWDGKEWLSGGDFSRPLYSLGVHDNQLYAGEGGRWQTGDARLFALSGADWLAVALPYRWEYIWQIVSDAGRLYVGGRNGWCEGNVAKLDKGRWETLGNGVSGANWFVYALLPQPEGLFVGGQFRFLGEPNCGHQWQSADRVARWVEVDEPMEL